MLSHLATVASEQPSPPSSSLVASEQCQIPSPPPSSLQAQHHVYHPPSHSPASVTVQGESQQAPRHVSVPAVAQNLQQSEERLLTRMVNMFQEMIEKMQERNTSRPTRSGRFQCAPQDRRPREAVCKDCNGSSHTTISHCKSERLCFACLAPGHTRLDCPSNNTPRPQFEGN